MKPMKPNIYYSIFFILAVVVPLLAGTYPNPADAAEQILTLKPSTSSSAPGMEFNLTVYYDVDDKNVSLTGTNIGIHFDSSKIQFVGYRSFFDVGDIKMAPLLAPDTGNLDKNDTTDMRVVMSWVDIDGNWPGVALPVPLSDLVFAVKNGVSPGSTDINAVVYHAPGGYKGIGKGSTINIE